MSKSLKGKIECIYGISALTKWQKPDSQLNCPCTPTQTCGFHSVPTYVSPCITPKEIVDNILGKEK